VVVCDLLNCTDEIANCSTSDASLVAPQNTGVASLLSSPSRVKRLEVGAIVGNQHAAFLGGKVKLLRVGHPTVGTAHLVYGDRVDATLPQSLGHPIADVFVKQECQTHRA